MSKRPPISRMSYDVDPDDPPEPTIRVLRKATGVIRRLDQTASINVNGKLITAQRNGIQRLSVGMTVRLEQRGDRRWYIVRRV